MGRAGLGLPVLVLGGLLFGQAEVLDLTKRIPPPERHYGRVEGVGRVGGNGLRRWR